MTPHDERTAAFVKELANVVNRFSREGSSNTSDFLLAEFMLGCLKAFEHSVTERDRLTGDGGPGTDAQPQQEPGEALRDPHRLESLSLCPCCQGNGILSHHGYPRTCAHCHGHGRIRETVPAEGVVARSGNVMHNSPLVSFLYTLMRDGDVSPGRVEELLKHNVVYGAASYSNGWLAVYASDVANRLREDVRAKA